MKAWQALCLFVCVHLKEKKRGFLFLSGSLSIALIIFIDIDIIFVIKAYFLSECIDFP